MPQRADPVLFTCSEPESEQYVERRKLIAEAQKRLMEDGSADGHGELAGLMMNCDTLHMAPSLAYHVKLLDVLAGTAVGRLNITTVEAKLQNLYKPKDLLVALLDSSVTLDVLVPLANFFYHAVIEVEIVVPDLCKSPDLWNYLDVCVSHFGEAKKQLERMQEQQVEKGHDATLTRKLLQFAFLSVANVQGFFTFYFNEAEMSAFTFNPLTSAQGASAAATSVTNNFGLTEPDEGDGLTWWASLIVRLYKSVRKLYDMESALLDASLQEILYDCCNTLEARMDENDRADFGKLRPLQLAGELADETVNMTDVERGLYEFIGELTGDASELEEEIEGERVSIVDVIDGERGDGIPSLLADSTSDLRLEPLIEKLVAHTRSRIKTVGEAKTLDAACTSTTTWIIKVFRRMIEKKWGMDIDARDDEGGEEQDIAAADVQDLLNDHGVTGLCLDLIVVGIDDELKQEAVNLCIALLFKEGGHDAVQDRMFQHLNSGSTDLFFEEIKEMLRKITEYYTYTDELPLSEDPDNPPDPDIDLHVIRFLQLMCEGHFEKNQDIMREQPNNAATINLLQPFVDLLARRRRSRAAVRPSPPTPSRRRSSK